MLYLVHPGFAIVPYGKSPKKLKTYYDNVLSAIECSKCEVVVTSMFPFGTTEYQLDAFGISERYPDTHPAIRLQSRLKKLYKHFQCTLKMFEKGGKVHLPNTYDEECHTFQELAKADKDVVLGGGFLLRCLEAAYGQLQELPLADECTFRLDGSLTYHALDHSACYRAKLLAELEESEIQSERSIMKLVKEYFSQHHETRLV